ncbi:hypothetical protein H5410_057934 [Solanum commersonii]|uniref:Uncharacterized protein n=1 Tax=Solanum commersonii TaxID=4109 RepID=A0A9J5WS47_SOLCO|nr:hypothetical protein H5410_057934 [Solanum commersonii]
MGRLLQGMGDFANFSSDFSGFSREEEENGGRGRFAVVEWAGLCIGKDLGLVLKELGSDLGLEIGRIGPWEQAHFLVF